MTISASTNLAANYIGGEWRRGASSTTAEITNPATAEALASLQLAEQDDADGRGRGGIRRVPGLAPHAAAGAHPVPVQVQAAARRQHADEIARLTTMENGKTLTEARAELQRGIENVEVACGIPTLMQGYNLEDVASGIDEIMIRQPLGVDGRDHAVQLPGDDPAVVPAVRDRLRQHVHPQAVRARAADRAASSSSCCDETGLPTGVVNLVVGGKPAVDALLRHPDVRAISFVGSTPGRALHLRGRRRRTASACSARAGRRTTSSSCPTPISR